MKKILLTFFLIPLSHIIFAIDFPDFITIYQIDWELYSHRSDRWKTNYQIEHLVIPFLEKYSEDKWWKKITQLNCESAWSEEWGKYIWKDCNEVEKNTENLNIYILEHFSWKLKWYAFIQYIPHAGILIFIVFICFYVLKNFDKKNQTTTSIIFFWIFPLFFIIWYDFYATLQGANPVFWDVWTSMFYWYGLTICGWIFILWDLILFGLYNYFRRK